jgi:C4-dicarboxylate-specific signal transduction histidine kinase
MRQTSRLTLRLAVTSVVSTVALAVACIVVLVALVSSSNRTRIAVSREVEILRDAAAFDALLYQKGFVANYMLTGDARWLRKLEAARAEFAAWFTRVRPLVGAREAKLLAHIEAENAQYDAARYRALALYDTGRIDEAKASLPGYHVHVDRLLALSQQFEQIGREDTEAALVSAERSVRNLAWLLVGGSVFTALASLTVGLLWARRIAKPMYELQLRVESAADKTRIRVAPGEDDVGALADHISELIARVEESDAALVEQRRRLVQSEKLSAVGELAAKLAHEILNPLAGMRAATQLLAVQAEAGELSAAEVAANAQALDNEISRVERLLRRLVGYAKPLSPDVEAVSIDSLFRAVVDAVGPYLRERSCVLDTRRQADLPPLEIDPLLMTQVLVNLVRNAAQAMPDGGRISLAAALLSAQGHGREQARITVEDEGPGVRAEHLPDLFKPFFTTKADGHGLGLAVSHNIVVEHGGTIAGGNRADAPGASFEVRLPLVR